MLTILFEEKYRIEINENLKDFECDVKKGAALLFFIEEKLTLGQAAEMAGMSQHDFILLYAKFLFFSKNYCSSKIKLP